MVNLPQKLRNGKAKRSSATTCPKPHTFCCEMTSGFGGKM
jgi:hypothetical protein